MVWLIVAVLALWPLVLAVAGQSEINGHAMAAGWELERDVKTPSYAVIEPESTDLSIDSLVLSCEQGPLRRGLQLRLYPSGDGTLYLQYSGDLTAELAIDGASYVVQLLFADTFVVVADSADGVTPLLSRSLLDALQAGQRMELRLQPVQKTRRQPTLAGTAAFNLQAGLGGAAVAAVRRCAGAPALQSANGLSKIIVCPYGRAVSPRWRAVERHNEATNRDLAVTRASARGGRSLGRVSSQSELSTLQMLAKFGKA
jgi:hypothetical protein